jgi:class 3 adenylate cyclase
MDIAEWLRGLELDEYEPVFRANAIDERVLPRLTAEDLKDLGINLVGHRRRLLDAIAALGAAQAPQAPFPPPIAAAEAERRQLTVMFCDLVGSTPLSTRFDPEDLREIVGAYHRCVTGIVARFGGFVAKYMGDGVLIYFGYPEAHEDDAERAARAGLAVIGAVGRLATQEPLNVRIGVASGLVVVGDLIGAGAAQEAAWSGRRQTSPPVCWCWPGPAPWSLPIAPGDRSARCSRSRISVPSRSPVLPSHSGLGV